MPIDEVFPNPTVKQVVFQIRFPNLFYLESRIGDFQVEIMNLFPESSLALQQPFIIANLGSNVKIEDLNERLNSENTKKIWSFSSPKHYAMNVLSDSLDITSQFHKTYNNAASENKFRDVIELVLEKFFDLMKLPIVTRIGLRYVDECPLPSKDTPTYLSHFNTAFNTQKYTIEEAQEVDFKTVVSRGPYFIRYIESLQLKGDSNIVILDFDAFAKNIKPDDCLQVTDSLHTIVQEEFSRTIKAPIFEFMRRNP